MRGKPVEPGNTAGRGRPPGRRNKKTVLQEVLESRGEAIVKQVQLQALKADPTAMRLCMERLLPVCKPPSSRFRLPPVRTTNDVVKALPTIMQAVARGQISAQEGEAIARIMESHL